MRVGIRLARSLHNYWRRMSAKERARLFPLADDVKERALDLRGFPDQEGAERGLQQANERLADAIVESAESDPDVPTIEVERLRADLVRELERLAGADISAYRGGRAAAEPES